jgi:hypothetical protein
MRSTRLGPVLCKASWADSGTDGDG